MRLRAAFFCPLSFVLEVGTRFIPLLSNVLSGITKALPYQFANQIECSIVVRGKTTVQRQIDATDAQIDKLVYELYDLSADEIKIVEAAAK